MSLSDLAALGSFVSGLAVLVSLIYLSLQVRQAERNQRALVQQARAARMVDMLLRAGDPSSADVLYKGASGDPSINADELRRFRSIVAAQLFSMEDTVLQHKAGLIDGPVFEGFRARLTAVFTQPGLRAAWRNTKSFHVPELQHFIDDIISTTPVMAAGDEVAKWIADVNAERPG